MSDQTPEELATRRRQLSVEFNNAMKELGELKKKKSTTIIELLDKHKTVAKAELYYSATKDGQREIELIYFTKGLIEVMRACKTEIEMKSAEAFGNY